MTPTRVMFPAMMGEGRHMMTLLYQFYKFSHWRAGKFSVEYYELLPKTNYTTPIIFVSKMNYIIELLDRVLSNRFH